MFNKKEKRAVGTLFPLIEREDSSARLHYTSLSIRKDGDRLTATFFQDQLPLYAQTFDVSGFDDFDIEFEDLQGEVRLKFIK